MIRVIDLAGSAAPMMVLLMTREMILRLFDMLSHVAGAIFSIVVCLLPGLSPYLILLPISALTLWGMLTRPSGAQSSRTANECSDSDRSLRSEGERNRQMPTHCFAGVASKEFYNDRDQN